MNVVHLISIYFYSCKECLDKSWTVFTFLVPSCGKFFVFEVDIFYKTCIKHQPFKCVYIPEVSDKLIENCDKCCLFSNIYDVNPLSIIEPAL